MESCHDANFVITSGTRCCHDSCHDASLVITSGSEVVIMTIYSATSDVKVGIIKILHFQCLGYGQSFLQSGTRDVQINSCQTNKNILWNKKAFHFDCVKSHCKHLDFISNTKLCYCCFQATFYHFTIRFIVNQNRL